LSAEDQSFSEHEQMIFTKAVSVAESFGKKVSLLVVPRGCLRRIGARRKFLEMDSVVSGVSSKMTAEEQAFHMGQAWKLCPSPSASSTFMSLIHAESQRSFT